MIYNCVFFVVSVLCIISCVSADVLGCGGFIKSHVLMDFSKVEVHLYTKTGILKETATCAPNNGYYFIPVYDLGEYVLKLQPPPGWSFNPTEVTLKLNGVHDLCSKEQDINFIFEGFGITGKVESYSSPGIGPAGVVVELKSSSEIRTTITTEGGDFFFTPVYPGDYKVTLSHPKWTFHKNAFAVTVAEGNTELSPDSLVVLGYDVTGVVKSEGKQIPDVIVILFSNDTNKQAHIRGCAKTVVTNIPKTKEKHQLCHMKTNDEGEFAFLSVPNGLYSIRPVHKSQNVHFEPKEVEFIVAHDSVTISNHFNIVGVSASGRILYGKNREGIPNVPVYLDNKKVAITDSEGRYDLEFVKIGQHQIHTVLDHFEFHPQEVYIQPSTPILPDIYPVKYKVCGKILSDYPETIIISQIGSTKFFIIETDTWNNFCEYLNPGKYILSVRVNNELENSVRFFPESHPIEIVDSPLFDIVFSQLKAKVTGEIDCIRQFDCDSLNVIMKCLSDDPSETLTANITNGKYQFNDVRPGKYEITLSFNMKCWNKNTQIITVSSIHEIVPTFKQTGYKVIFVSTHDTDTNYKIMGESKKEYNLKIFEGRNPYCVEKPGNYTFTFQNCHVFEDEIIEFETDSDSNVIYITALKHRISLQIKAEETDPQMYVMVNINGKKSQHTPLNYLNGTYTVSLYLTKTESAILVPESEIYYFDPPILSVQGEEDCTNLGVKFVAIKGKVFKGQVTPPLEGVLVTIETDKTGEALMVETDAKGFYRFQPLDDSKTYRLSAKKESYVLIGPDQNNNFLARKLAEVKVEVIDDKNASLQGTLLSLSGGQSYRSNLQTDENGKITFYSLSPGDYFLRPVMKEYTFEPVSKMIQVKEGATVVVHLKATRIAYSGYGALTSLNGENEDHMTILAKGLGNCSKYSEETSTEASGLFRIRGLQPYCDYEVSIKGSLDPSNPIERTLPEVLPISVANQDLTDLKFKIFRQNQNMDILVYVQLENPELHKSLRLKLQRESSPASVIHSVKVDTSMAKSSRDNTAGLIIQLPSILWDNKSYSVQVETSQSMYPSFKSEIEYFVANSSFISININMLSQNGTGDHQMKQTSIWPLIFVFSCFVVLYFIEDPLRHLNSFIAKLNIATLGNNLVGFTQKSVQNEVLDNNDIDQIVQNINATKKTKTRKI